MSETIYRIDNLTKHYGKFKALDAVDLEIGKGKIIGLLGKNGAGKSTLVKLAGMSPGETTGYLKMWRSSRM